MKKIIFVLCLFTCFVKAQITKNGATGWGLTGNSVTNPSVNFIGTTDNNPLVVRTANDTALKVNIDKSIQLYNSVFDNSQDGSIYFSDENNAGVGFLFNSNNILGIESSFMTMRDNSLVFGWLTDGSSIIKIGTYSINDLQVFTGTSPSQFVFNKAGYNTSMGKLYLGPTGVVPSAFLSIRAPIPSAAQINLASSGVVPSGTNVIAGNIYRAGDDYFVTIATGTVTQKIQRCSTGLGVLDFPSTAAGTSSDLTISVTGAADGDPVSVGVPNASTLTNGVFTAWVSAAGTVKVRFANTNLVTALDPASGTFKVTVNKN